jgi:nucleotide-binding universal stress UspA family protein
MDTKMNHIILVPVDFTDVTENAMYQAVNAGKHLEAKVVLLHVIDKNTKAQLKKENKGIDAINDKLKEIALKVSKENNVEVDFIAKEGDIFTTIGEVAKDIGAKLLYLGTHGKVGMQKIKGSFAIRVVTSSPVPVVVVQKKPVDHGYKKIVLPITSDAGPWEKTKWATFIAKNFGSEIDIYRLPAPDLDETIKIISGHFDKEGVKYSIINAGSGDFTKKVVEHATAVYADMIMIMTNPDSSFTKFLLGSYDEDMIFNTSQIPVMCINPRKYNWEKIFKI